MRWHWSPSPSPSPTAASIREDELTVLLTEFKDGIGRYLKGSPAPIAVRSLSDLIAFDAAHQAAEMPLFGQETFIAAEKTTGVGTPAYRKARAGSLRAAGPNGIDRLLKANNVVALVGPTMPPAWKIDAVRPVSVSQSSWMSCTESTALMID